MAIAKFFDKAALAASQILEGYDTDVFAQKLTDSPVEIAFDNNAITSKEGLATIDMTIRLLARLYPKLIISALDPGAEEVKSSLIALALSISPVIEISNESPVSSIVIGVTSVNREEPVFYIGSYGWNVRFSVKNPVGSGNTSVPFAAGAAACFATGNVFRHVFAGQLTASSLDTDFTLSLMDFSQTEYDGNTEHTWHADNVILVGLGAIGHGALWALSNTQGLKGTIQLIDDEAIDLSNLQRYILTKDDDVNAHKVDLAASALGASELTVVPHKGEWASYVAGLTEWKLPTVLVAVDNAWDRITIQSSLPKEIINAWTQPDELGISRHFDFVEKACVACLYPPRLGMKPQSVLVAEALGIPDREIHVREHIYNNSPVPQELLIAIATAKNISVDILRPFADLPIMQFYSKVVCGGIVMTTGSDQTIETPMAFQSALAGILLVSELLIQKMKLRTEDIETTTRINLLRPLAHYLNDPVVKSTGHCLCKDDDFLRQYKHKYGL